MINLSNNRHLFYFCNMEEQLIDFDFLEELSGGEPIYKYELLDIFLVTVDEGMANLQKLVEGNKDFDGIFKQAHALKSSAGIIKVRDMHARLARIEELSRAISEKRITTGKEEISELLNMVKETYDKAHPLLLAERDKNKPTE